MRRRKWIIAAVAIAALLCAALFTAWDWQNGPEPTEPVALVNGAGISLKELQREMKKIRDRYAMQNIFPGETELGQLKQQMLDRLVKRELLWQQAVREGLVVADEAVSEELEALKKQYGNEAILNNMLENREMSRQEFLFLIRKDLSIEALINREIAEDVTVSDALCQAYYDDNRSKFEEPEKIRVSHIAVFFDRDASDAEKQKARASVQSIAQRLKDGETFEALAREASDCASSERGGDLGFIARGSMDPLFEKAAFALDLDELSPVVKSSMGYHIIKVTDRKPARTLAFDQVKDSIRARLKEQKTGEALSAHAEELLKQAEVKYLLK